MSLERFALRLGEWLEYELDPRSDIPRPAPLPDDWRVQLDELRAQLSRPDKPCTCPRSVAPWDAQSTIIHYSEGCPRHGQAARRLPHDAGLEELRATLVKLYELDKDKSPPEGA